MNLDQAIERRGKKMKYCAFLAKFVYCRQYDTHGQTGLEHYQKIFGGLL